MSKIALAVLLVVLSVLGTGLLTALLIATLHLLVILSNVLL
jgi:hypothetical protein